LFSDEKEVVVPLFRHIAFKMNDLKVSMQNYVHKLNRVDEMNVLLKVVFHQTRHIKEAKVLKFCQIDVLDMVIEKGLQNLHRFDRNIAS
jgi:hypothetical protein